MSRSSHQHMANYNSKGFTLVELMIVVAVIAVLGAISIPLYRDYIAGAKERSARATLEQFPILLETFRAENGSMCSACSSNGVYTFNYTEDNNASITSETIRISGGTPYLQDFKAKPSTSVNEATLYHYTLSITVTNCGTATGCNEVATFTATPQTGRGAPPGAITATY